MASNSLYEDLKSHPALNDSLKNKAVRVTTSCAAFIIATIISNTLLQILIARIARSFKYTVRFSYNLMQVLPRDIRYWSNNKVMLVFLLPLLICLIMGLIVFYLLRVNSNWGNRYRIFFFWISVTLVNCTLTHILLAPLGNPDNSSNGLYQTFSVVGVWLRLNGAIMGLFAVIALIISVCMGLLFRTEIMRYSYSKQLIKTKKGMNAMVIQVYVLPVLAGVLPVLIISSRISLFTHAVQIVNLAIISLGIFIINSASTPYVRCYKKDILNHFPTIELLCCVAILLGVFFLFR